MPLNKETKPTVSSLVIQIKIAVQVTQSQRILVLIFPKQVSLREAGEKSLVNDKYLFLIFYHFCSKIVEMKRILQE